MDQPENVTRISTEGTASAPQLTVTRSGCPFLSLEVQVCGALLSTLTLG